MPQGNLPTITREEIVDMVEELMIMGVTKRHEIWRIVQKRGLMADVRTLGKYMDIVRRRSRKLYRKHDLKEILRKELMSLDYMEKMSWANYHASQSGPERSAAMITLTKVKERRAKLLGLDTENVAPQTSKTLEDLIRENDEENEPTIDRRPVLDSGQAGPAGEIPAEQNTAIPGPKPDGEGSDSEGAPKGS